MKYSRISTDDICSETEGQTVNVSEATDQNPVLGFVYVAASGVFLTGTLIIVKWFDSLTPLSWLFYRCLVNFLLNAAVLLWQRTPITEWFGTEKRQVMFLCLRALSGGFAAYLTFAAFQSLELENASCFKQTKPVWTCILAYYVLNEKLDLVEICLITIIICGLIVASRASFMFGVSASSPGLIYGSFAALISAILSSVVFTSIKKVKVIKPDTPNLVIVNWSMLGGILVSCSSFLIHRTSFQIVKGWQIFGVCFAGSLSFFSHILKTAGIGMARVGPVSSVKSSEIIWMFLFQGLIWGFDRRGLVYSISGAFAISFGSVSLGLHKWRKARNKKTLSGMVVEQELELVNLESNMIAKSREDCENLSLLESSDNKGNFNDRY